MTVTHRARDLGSNTAAHYLPGVMLYGLSGLDLNGSAQVAAFHCDADRMTVAFEPPVQNGAFPSPIPPPQPFASPVLPCL
jgi:hypothetical protein